MTNFTPDELLLFYYGEAPAGQAREINSAIDQQWTLREKLNVMSEAAEILDEALQRPRSQSVKAILAYAEGTVRTLLQRN
jgi:hypothetical protein